MSLPPGPTSPGVVQLTRWVHHPTSYLEACRERYGDAFTLRLAGFGESGFSDVVFLSDPEVVAKIFSGGPSFSRVAKSRQPLQAMFGKRSVLVVDGDDHLRQRKLLLPPFHGAKLAGYERSVNRIAASAIKGWPRGRPFAVQERLQTITFEVIMEVIFGLSDPERRQRIASRVERMLALVASPLAELFMGLPGKIGPINIRGQVERAVAAADAALLEEIADRRRAPDLDQRDDVLSMLLLAQDETGRGLSDEELRDELVTLLLAGHETTATALAWTMMYLSRDRLLTERLRGEGDDALLDATLTESMRLRPPLPIADRVLEEPLQVDGHTLAPGTFVAVCIYLVHARGDLYEDPEAFMPERFLGGAPEPYSLIPFGGGMRRCIGASFAMLEMRTILRAVLDQAELRPASKAYEAPRRRAIVIAPSGGGRLVLD